MICPSSCAYDVRSSTPHSFRIRNSNRVVHVFIACQSLFVPTYQTPGSTKQANVITLMRVPLQGPECSLSTTYPHPRLLRFTPQSHMYCFNPSNLQPTQPQRNLNATSTQCQRELNSWYSRSPQIVNNYPHTSEIGHRFCFFALVIIVRSVTWLPFLKITCRLRASPIVSLSAPYCLFFLFYRHSPILQSERMQPLNHTFPSLSFGPFRCPPRACSCTFEYVDSSLLF